MWGTLWAPVRTLALLLLLAVLPSVELAEQLVHAAGHLVAAEPLDHGAHATDRAHHGGAPAAPGARAAAPSARPRAVPPGPAGVGADEHGCTGLVHLCGSHPAQMMPIGPIAPARAGALGPIAGVRAPRSLVDLTSPEPLHRPPIG